MTWKSLVFVALKFPLGIASIGDRLPRLRRAGAAFAPIIVLITPVTVFGWIVTSFARRSR